MRSFDSSTIALFAIPLRLMPPMERFPSDDPYKLFHGGQGMVKVHSGDRKRNIAESFNPLRRVHERYRR